MSRRALSREAWEARVAARQDRCGGDYWNPDQIWRAVWRRFPDARAASYDYIGTGLWVDVVLTSADGSKREVRL